MPYDDMLVFEERASRVVENISNPAKFVAALRRKK
jgi:hypothetical protein